MKTKNVMNISRKEIESQLKSAIDQLTPNVLGSIDLTTPQEKYPEISSVVKLQHKIRPLLAAAACVCMLVVSGGVYAYQENEVVSIVDVDVNPSIEFSLNRREKVLKVIAVNEDGSKIIDDKSLKGKSFNTAMYQTVGSMKEQGFLHERNSAILVSVTPVNEKAANKIEEAIVEDVKKTLQDHQVQAIVYQQKVIASEDLESLAKEYNISIGKANFLKEMIESNEGLSIESMGKLSNLKLDQLSEEISAGIYLVGDEVIISDSEVIEEEDEQSLDDKEEEDSFSKRYEQPNKQVIEEEDTESVVESTPESSHKAPMMTEKVPKTTETAAVQSSEIETEDDEIDRIGTPSQVKIEVLNLSDQIEETLPIADEDEAAQDKTEEEWIISESESLLIESISGLTETIEETSTAIKEGFVFIGNNAV